MFRSGRLTTGFLGEAFPGGWNEDPSALRDARVAVALSAVREAAAGARIGHGERTDYWQRQSGYRSMSAAGRSAVARLRVECDGTEAAVAVARDRDGWRVSLNQEEPAGVRADWLANGQLLLTPQHGASRRFTLTQDGDSVVVNHSGTRWRMNVASELQALARVAIRASALGSDVLSEMPGAITTINVAAGDAVEAGHVLVVMEAMKLIFPLIAPRAGTIAAVHCEIGEIVPRGQTLVSLEPLEAAAALAS